MSRGDRVRRAALQITALTLLYLAMVGSVTPGDVLIGVIVAFLAGRVARQAGIQPHPVPPEDTAPVRHRIVGSIRLGTSVLRAIATGSWRTVLWCLAPRRAGEDPGTVWVDRSGRTESGVAAWGVITALSPDEFPVTVEADRLCVHVLDTADADALARRHQDDYRRVHRRVFP